MTRVLAFHHALQIAGFILVDSVISATKGSRTPPAMPRVKTHHYPTPEAGMKRFRLRPYQPCENRFLIEYIARHSLKQTTAGFQFKVDPLVFSKMAALDLPDAATMVRSISIPRGFIYGDQSRFFPTESVSLVTSLFAKGHVRKVTRAHHHVFLDQPKMFIQTLKELLVTIAGAPDQARDIL